VRGLALCAIVLAAGCDRAVDAAPPTRVVCRDGLRVATVDGRRRKGLCDLDEAVNQRCRFGLPAGDRAENVIMGFGRRVVRTGDGKRWALRCRRSGLSRPGAGY
jgi:hypothetical protein